MRLRDRVLVHFRLKVAVLLGLAIGICVPYFGLQQVELSAPVTPPTTPLDVWIPFDPSWVWAYQSIALLVPLFPLLARSRDQLVRYAKGLAFLCLPCFAIFLVFPAEGPRPGILPDYQSYQWIVSVDRPTNALPSLHAGLTVYSLLFGGRILRADVGPRTWRVYMVVAVVWAGAILYATIAIRQHFAIDLPPGMLLAWLADRWAWRTAIQ